MNTTFATRKIPDIIKSPTHKKVGTGAELRQRPVESRDVPNEDSLGYRVAEYIDHMERALNLSRYTVQVSAYTLRQFVEYFEGRSVETITISEVHDYLSYRLNQVSQASLNTERSYIRRFLFFVERYKGGQLLFDPALIRNARVEKPKVRFHEVAEIESYLNSVSDEKERLIYFTLFNTGMRIGELVDFRVEDFYGQEISVRGKGGAKRVVPIAPELSQALTHYMEVNNISRGHVFQGKSGKYTVSGLRKKLERGARYDGREYFNPHSMRHSIATALLRNGMDIRAVQVFLGHTHIQTTMRYLHVTDQHLRDSYIASYPKLNARI